MCVARAMGLSRLSLETGSWPYFLPAREFYKKSWLPLKLDHGAINIRLPRFCLGSQCPLWTKSRQARDRRKRGSTFAAVQPGLKKALQAGLSFFWFLCMHSVMRGTSGIVSRQMRKASSLHARRCSGVPCEKLAVENVPIDTTNATNLIRRKPLFVIN